jgi:hypothetical protein
VRSARAGGIDNQKTFISLSKNYNRSELNLIIIGLWGDLIQFFANDSSYNSIFKTLKSIIFALKMISRLNYVKKLKQTLTYS